MEKIGWFEEARFGMFIHWGLYSITERDCWVMDEEHIPVKEYSRLAGRFTASKFDARKIVSLAKEAGMKYIAFTSKHHDGFCLFDSKLTDYTSMRSPANRDFVRELAEECHKEKIKIFLYYSQMDWYHPAYQESLSIGSAVSREYINYFHGQIRELCSNYGKIDCFWFDGEWDHTADQWQMDDLIDMIHKLQPTALVNDRLGTGTRGKGGDFTTAEQYIPTAAPEIPAPKRPWESNMTMNDKWGYFKGDHNWKSTRQLIQDLARCVSNNGNYLLDIGPKPDGTVPLPSITRLRQMGAWMKKNGESIYGAGRSPFGRGTLGVWTAKDDKVYRHVFYWPGKEICAAEIKSEVRSIYFLHNKEKIDFVQKGERVFLKNLPGKSPDPYDTVVVFKLKKRLDSIPVSRVEREWH